MAGLLAKNRGQSKKREKIDWAEDIQWQSGQPLE
jgi:hypothetical protein